MLKLSKKFALPLIAVLLIGTGVGCYLLFRNFQLPRYFVDRYPELLEYCDTEESKDGLKISCKALMLEIKPNVSDGAPSLTSLIIANDEELREYTITEKEEVFAWTNEVLQFKKLKPIIINIQYTKKNPITYSIQGITFEDIPETYIQEIVNRDIDEIMGMDKSSTTILNSFDFCPRPEILPDYVIKKEEYAKYWEENILSQEEYLDGFNYNIDDTIIRLFFACKSTQNLNYPNVCNAYSEELSPQQPSQTLILNETTVDETKIIEPLKDISLFYDNEYLKTQGPETIKSLEELTSTLATDPAITYSVLCAYMELLKNKGFDSYSEYKNTIEENFSSIGTSLCVPLITEDQFDQSGIYLKILFSLENNKKSNLTLFERCNNLNLYAQ